MEVTFHRAFDLTADPVRAMEDIIGVGIDRILTSGQAASAEAGSGLIKRLVSLAKGRISIMPGSGIGENNVIRIIRETGAGEVHASLRAPVKSRMTYAGNAVSMASAGQIEPSWQETSTERVKGVITILQREFSL
jgi:copper homeostasis protein